MKWENAVEGYWLDRRRSLSKATMSDYSLTFRRFGEWVKNADIHKIKASQVNRFLDHLTEDLELSEKTVLNAWIALSSFYTWANKEFKIPHILRDVERPRPTERMRQAFTEDEVRRILAATTNMNAYDRRNKRHVAGRRPTAERDAAIILLLLDAGLRVSGLCDLQMRHFDRKSGRLLVERGKGNKQRVVYIGQSARRGLWRYLTTRGEVAQTAPLITSSTGKRFNRDSVRKMILRAGERCGVTGATPHRFRHTFAINFLRNGGNMAALQDMLGHATLEMVRRYARLAEVDLAEAQRVASPADNWGL